MHGSGSFACGLRRGSGSPVPSIPSRALHPTTPPQALDKYVKNFPHDAFILGIFADYKRPTHNLWVKGAERLRPPYRFCDISVEQAAASKVPNRAPRQQPRAMATCQHSRAPTATCHAPPRAVPPATHASCRAAVFLGRQSGPCAQSVRHHPTNQMGRQGRDAICSRDGLPHDGGNVTAV